MADLVELAVRYLEIYGPIALLAFTFLESSMLFPLLPSEVVVPAAAALLVRGPVSFAVFVLAAAVGGTAGASVPYYVFQRSRLGERDWFRDRIDVSDRDLDRGREWFRRWDRSSVLWGRFLLILRSLVSVPAGLSGMDRARFGAYTAVGTVGFYAAIGAVVYYGRQQSVFAAAYALVRDNPALAAVALLAVVAVGVLTVGLDRSPLRLSGASRLPWRADHSERVGGGGRSADLASRHRFPRRERAPPYER